jgi:hypothetical protein
MVMRNHLFGLPLGILTLCVSTSFLPVAASESAGASNGTAYHIIDVTNKTVNTKNHGSFSVSANDSGFSIAGNQSAGAGTSTWTNLSTGKTVTTSSYHEALAGSGGSFGFTASSSTGGNLQIGGYATPGQPPAVMANGSNNSGSFSLVKVQGQPVEVTEEVSSISQ